MTEAVIWIAAAVGVIASVAAVSAYRLNKEYECPLCRRVFRPGPGNCLRVLYSFPEGGRALKCPHCGEKSVMDTVNR